MVKSPFFRIPFLAFTVIATVATSQPEWHLEARVLDEDVELAPGESISRKVEYSGSHRVQFRSTFAGAVPAETKIWLAHDDPAVETDPTWDESMMTLEEQRAWTDRWLDEGEPCERVVRLVVGEDHRDGPASRCDTMGTLTFTLRNEASSPAKLHWSVVASVGEEGDDDPPDGAFVRAEVVP